MIALLVRLLGGIVGVLYSIAAFSAFLFQFLQALRDATVALATVVLAIATISLYRATSGAMSNYGERRKFLNQQIETMSETAREALEALLTELKSLH